MEESLFLGEAVETDGYVVEEMRTKPGESTQGWCC